MASSHPYNNRDLQNSNSKERSAEPTPPAIEKISPQSATEIEQREQEKARQDRRLADYTELLFFATLILGLATSGLVAVAYLQMRDARRSIDASVNAANAAAASAKAADRNIALAPRGTLYLIGYIVYDSEAGRQHMAFGREYDRGSQRFIPISDPNYEYGE